MLPSVVIYNGGFSMKLSVAIQDDLLMCQLKLEEFGSKFMAHQ